MNRAAQESGSVGVQSLQAVDALCDEFESAWRDGGRPRLEDFLVRADASHRSELLRELLVLELEYRRERGESTGFDEFLERFPDASDVVKSVFSGAGSNDTTAAARTRPETRGEVADAPKVPGYEIDGILGQGGMGIVYRARQLVLNRTVAIKTIVSFSQSRSEEIARFMAEAEAVARLQHPNIVQIFEVGQVGNLPYFSLELMAGGSLRDHCKEPLEARRAAGLVETLARAVQHLHSHNIVHRDLKPANVLLTADQTPKISDFGLAKFLGNESGQTKTGDVLGTPSYMAPEQASGRVQDVGPLADVYALGAILYELLTGKAPFRGATPIETIRLVLDVEPAAPRKVRPELPRDLETICLKCLEKDPKRRYGSAGELGDDLHRFLADEPIRARAVGPIERVRKWARRRPALASLIVVATVAAVTIFVGGFRYSARLSSALYDVRQTSEDRRRSLVRLQLEAANRATDSGDWLGALPWLGEALKLSADEYDESKRHLQRIGAILDKSPRLAQVWTFDDAVRHASFSPDGRRLAIACGDGAARIVDVATGELVVPEMRHKGYVCLAAFTADGSRLLTASHDGTARVWNAATGQPVTDVFQALYGPLHHAALSPDGSMLMTCAESGGELWDVKTGARIEEMKFPLGPLIYGTFNKDGTQALVVNATFIGEVREIPSGKVLTHRKVLAAGLRPGKNIQYGEFSPDGSLALLPFLKAPEVWDTKQWKNSAISTFNWPTLHAALSPNGKQVATGGSDGALRLWGEGAQNLSSFYEPMQHGAPIHFLAYGPDGRQIVTVGADYSAQVWHLPTATKLGPRLVHGGILYHAAFSPDGRYLVTTGDEGVVRLWDLAPLWPADRKLLERYVSAAEFDAAGKFAASNGDNFDPATLSLWEPPTGRTLGTQPLGANLARHAVSEDGKTIATVTDKNDLQFWSTTPLRLSAGPVRVKGGVVKLGFSPNGDRLWTISVDSQLINGVWSSDAYVTVWDVATGREVLAAQPTNRVFTMAAISPDSKMLVAGNKTMGVLVYPLTDDAVLPFPRLSRFRDQTWAAFSPDSKQLVTLGNDRKAQVWNLATGEHAAPRLPSSDDLHFAIFSPNSQVVATGGFDRTARTWNVSSGHAISAPMHHRGEVYAARFSPDGKLLYTRTDKEHRVWDAATGMPVTPSWQSSFGRVHDVRFTDDGVKIFFANGTTTTWSFATSPFANSGNFNDDVERLIEQVKVLSGRKIEGDNVAAFVSNDELAKLFQKHKRPSKTSIATWHRNEASADPGILRTGEWHLDRLIQVAPERNAYLRRATIRDRHGDPAGAEQDREKAKAMK